MAQGGGGLADDRLAWGVTAASNSWPGSPSGG